MRQQDSARQRAMILRDKATAQEAAYARVSAATAAVSAHIDRHGADGLVALCAPYAGDGLTTCSAILGIVLRRLGKEARDDVREVLP